MGERKTLNVLGLQLVVNTTPVADTGPSVGWLAMQHASEAERLAYIDDVMPPDRDDPLDDFDPMSTLPDVGRINVLGIKRK